MKGVQCYELFGGIALKNHALFIYILKTGHLNFGILLSKIDEVRLIFKRSHVEAITLCET